MPRTQTGLRETHIIGTDTHRKIVMAEDCPILGQHHIMHVGVADAVAPYRIVRMNLSGAYLLATLDGEGRMLIDGRWRRHSTGMASLAPAHVQHAFHATRLSRWRFCWVKYMATAPWSAFDAMNPIMAHFDCRPLGYAIRGLVSEWDGNKDLANCALWADLVERYANLFAEPWRREERLLPVWRTVQRHLARDWTVSEISAVAGMSGEHLRRLCQQSFGRSPMKHLANLRIQRAAHMLATTNDSIDEIAGRVGYSNPFAFSNTFKKMTGVRPSVFRACHRSRDGRDAEPE